jgi:hypothetical protein
MELEVALGIDLGMKLGMELGSKLGTDLGESLLGLELGAVPWIGNQINPQIEIRIDTMTRNRICTRISTWTVFGS